MNDLARFQAPGNRVSCGASRRSPALQPGVMVHFTAALLAGLSLSSTCAAYQISVKATGGNATSRTQYGIMHEVCRCVYILSRY